MIFGKKNMKSEVKQFEKVSQMKKYRVTGYRWFLGVVIDGMYDGRYVILELSLTFVKWILNENVKGYLAVYSDEMEPIAVCIPKESPIKEEFNKLFPHNVVMNVAKSHDLMVKKISDHYANGNQGFAYDHIQNKVFKANLDGMMSCIELMTTDNRFQFSFAIYTEDLKYIRGMSHPAHKDHNLRNLLGASLAVYLDHETMPDDFDVLENII